MKKVWLLTLLLVADVSAYAATSHKDFKGLFGSYRREKFTENEANSSDFGFDLLLSTLIPVSPVVKSQEALGGPFSALNYSTFFNVEAGIHVSIAYRWQIFLDLGYMNYDTRKENTGLTNPALPLFHQFDMTVVPLLLGFRYRFSTEDIVPYVGLGAGISYVRRKGSYDYNDVIFKEEFLTAFTAEAVVGFEFYFAPRAGIRLEASAFYLKVPETSFTPGAAPADLPNLLFQANNWSVRYASGLFFLF